MIDPSMIDSSKRYVPGADEFIPLCAVSRCGFDTDAPTAAYGPEDLFRAWAPD